MISRPLLGALSPLPAHDAPVRTAVSVENEFVGASLRCWSRRRRPGGVGTEQKMRMFECDGEEMELLLWSLLSLPSQGPSPVPNHHPICSSLIA